MVGYLSTLREQDRVQCGALRHDLWRPEVEPEIETYRATTTSFVEDGALVDLLGEQDRVQCGAPGLDLWRPEVPALSGTRIRNFRCHYDKFCREWGTCRPSRRAGSSAVKRART